MGFWDYLAERKRLSVEAHRISLERDGGWKEPHKFWAFAGLIGAVLILATVAALTSAIDKNGVATDPTVLQAKLAILNMAMGGLIGGLGAAAQAFFRTDKVDEQRAKSTAAAFRAVEAAAVAGTVTPTSTPRQEPK